MNLKKFSSIYLPYLEKRLQDKVKGKSTLFSALQYALFPGGKRFRPLLVMATTYVLGSEVRKSLDVAVAVELIHNFTLIHDDLPGIDNDNFRRGKPTLHKAFGVGFAILAGDALFNLAFSSIAESSLSPTKKVEILKVITRALGIEGVIGGQVEDITIGKEEKNLRKLKKVYYLKTATLIQASVECGGIIGEANHEQRLSLRNFGENLGMAFQIMDDVREAKEGKIPHYPDFPTILGIEKARKKGEEFGKKAVESLEIFGESGNILREFVDKITL